MTVELETLRAQIHEAIEEHGANIVLLEVSQAVSDHASQHVQADATGRGPMNRWAARLLSIADAVSRVADRAAAIPNRTNGA